MSSALVLFYENVDHLEKKKILSICFESREYIYLRTCETLILFSVSEMFCGEQLMCNYKDNEDLNVLFRIVNYYTSSCSKLENEMKIN